VQGQGERPIARYAQEWLETLPDAVWESAAAVGNPFAVAAIAVGKRSSIWAAGRVPMLRGGPSGRSSGRVRRRGLHTSDESPRPAPTPQRRV